MMHYRAGRAGISAAAYPDLAAYYHDLGVTYNKAIKAFYAAGCRYLQLDDTSLAYFCDPAQIKMLADRGDDPKQLVTQYRDTLAIALKDRPKDMTITTHTCRGNFRSTFVASGGYEPVSDMVFNHIDVDGKQIRLTPGMNLTAEIKTGRRRVIEYLLSPIQRAGSESLRER